jgi:hypothetical protein
VSTMLTVRSRVQRCRGRIYVLSRAERSPEESVLCQTSDPEDIDGTGDVALLLNVEPRWPTLGCA